MVAARVFALLYCDEWSGVLFSIRRVCGNNQFQNIHNEIVTKRNLKVGEKYNFEQKPIIFLTGGSYAHCLSFFDYYCNMYFKYGSKIFEKSSRSYLFKHSKTKTEAIKDCENDPVGEYAMRKLFNKHDE